MPKKTRKMIGVWQFADGRTIEAPANGIGRIELSAENNVDVINDVADALISVKKDTTRHNTYVTYKERKAVFDKEVDALRKALGV
ncbi:MAG: hypothetical protein RSC44_05815 [Clostridia bacterium]